MAHLADEGADIARDLIFVSYSHEDAAWVQRFRVLLKPLVRRKRLTLWADTAIRTGDQWHSEIERAITRSRVALLLVSADLLASDFVMDHELPALVRHRVRLAPVLVGDCYWQEIPELAGVQWLHDPGRDEPLNLIDANRPGQRDRRIREACDRLLYIAPSAQPVNRSEPARDGSVLSLVVTDVPAGAMRGDLSEVPPLPPGYVVRPELDELVDAVVTGRSGGAIGLTAEPSAVGLHGQGGMGKSVLAAALARDSRIRDRFPEGVYWVAVGEHPDLLNLQLELLERLGDNARSPRTVSEATRTLRSVLGERQVLLVVDDVWSDAAAHAFRVIGPRGRLLYTSRDQQVITAVGAVAHGVGVLTPEAARALASGVLDRPVSTLPNAADQAFAEVGLVPLAVALLAAAVRGGRSWDQVGVDLDRDLDVYGEHPYASTFRAMQISVVALPAHLRTALLGLAVFPPDTSVPVAAVARYWAHTRGLDAAETVADLDRLASANMLRRDMDTIGFHDLQHDYLLLHSPPLAMLHADLLDAYRVLLPCTGKDEWWRLPLDEPYIWEQQHLVAHLAGAGDRRSLAATVVDPAYQARLITASGPHAGEAALALAARYLPDHPLVAWWYGWLGRHSHLLTSRRAADEDIRTRLGWRIASSLLAWLSADPQRPPDIRPERLAPLVSRPYLAIRSGLNSSPSALLRVLAGHTSVVTAVAFVPRRHPPGHRQRRPDGAAVGPDHRPDHHHPHRPHRRGDRGGVLPRRHPPGHRQRRRHGAAVGPRPPASTTAPPSPATPTAVTAVAWSPDGTRLATASDDSTVRLWDPDHRPDHAPPSPATPTAVTAVASSPDGTRLATASDDNDGAAVGPRPPARPPTTLTGHTDAVTAVAFVPRRHPPGHRQLRRDGAAVGPDHRPAPPPPSPATPARCSAVACSPDGTRLATASGDGTVRLWDPATGQTTHHPHRPHRLVMAVAFSPDGTRLATASDDGTVRLWDPDHRPDPTTLTGHTNVVTRWRSPPTAPAWPPPATTDGAAVGPRPPARPPPPSPATPTR